MKTLAKLSNKVAVVTGASKGIGAEIAKQLAAEGAAVIVNYANSKAAADAVVADILHEGGQATAVQADIASLPDIARLFEVAHKTYGKIDILVNNAGIYNPTPFGEITTDNFNKHMHLNVLGLLLASQEASKYFPVSGGNIINISSVVSTLGFPGLVVYNATKAAVDATTRTLAKELATRNIRVNSINPGMVDTEGLHDTGMIHNRTQVVAMTPLGRIGTPKDIAPAVVFFASEDSSWITGETLFITGGMR